jgi:hypothetical protein
MRTEAKPIDKSRWGEGPWHTEPDHVEFEHVGHPCILHRVESHAGWCGYVAVPPGHPWHGKGESDIAADVHGGLTYAQGCEGDICHVPKPGEPDNVWWVGFDTAHSGDASPGHAEHSFATFSGYETYKTVGYVRDETERLAEQAREAAK